MSSNQDAPTTRRSSFWGTVRLVAIATPILMFLICTELIVPVIYYPGMLLFGWIGFLRRVVPLITIDPGAIFGFGLCAFVLAIGTHRMALWLTKPDRTLEVSRNSSRFAWRFRWTCMLLAAIGCSFVAGVCLVGMAHELTWMATSKEPLTKPDGFWLYHHARQAERRLEDLGPAFRKTYEDSGEFPASMTFDDKGFALHGWALKLLPYLDQGPLIEEIHQDQPWSAEVNQPAFRKQVAAFLSPGLNFVPDKAQYAPIHFAGNSHLLQPNRRRPTKEITDGWSSTILLGEIKTNIPPWGKPGNCRDPVLGLNRSPEGFSTPFTSSTIDGRRVMFLMADGHVRHVSENIDSKILRGLATPNGGEPPDKE